jgi:hypothetical protein
LGAGVAYGKDSSQYGPKGRARERLVNGRLPKPTDLKPQLVPD